VVGSAPDPRFDDLVELARTAFGTESAELNFIDRDRQWKMAVAGAERGEQPRGTSFCNLTIQSSEPTVVEDARLHPVLRLTPAVRGPRSVRFYAACPIESAGGYRVGTLCIYDSQPRPAEEVNLDVLRDLALLAQAELTGVDTGPIDSPLVPSGAAGTMGR
jgi:GAF domain-containing protein